ncbi:Asp23/Gls24 family envelope stress response protein [Staphylococcus durrellii]|uniref:Asp23/Gls24 family envelope stress response protein n=1 Tax=Staphylococcus durrellii TaxID=2781773 RepID=UPI00189DD837|nr:Asp23/Gls24 family envelope stress response protein [Staphylococcus durrellii]MBF7017037.1 Asp23/Gls24 family envelope stress response protein [Staphylococcus durrellii]
MVKISEQAQTNLGEIEISTEVITRIVSIATSQIDGLHGHFKELKHADFDEITQRQLNKGLRVNIEDNFIYIDIYCAFEHGANIAETAKNIQQSVYNLLQTLISIEPKQINIHISHIATEHVNNTK